jgi:hypothetical protein
MVKVVSSRHHHMRWMRMAVESNGHEGSLGVKSQEVWQGSDHVLRVMHRDQPDIEWTGRIELRVW